MKLTDIVNNELARIEQAETERINAARHRRTDAMRKAEHAYNEFVELEQYGVNVVIGNSHLPSGVPCVVITNANGDVFEIHYNDDILKTFPNWRGGLYNVFKPKEWSYTVPLSKPEVAIAFANWIRN